MRDLCQVPLDFVLTRKRACPPKGYTYPVVLVLKQQHERENKRLPAFVVREILYQHPGIASVTPEPQPVREFCSHS